MKVDKVLGKELEAKIRKSLGTPGKIEGPVVIPAGVGRLTPLEELVGDKNQGEELILLAEAILTRSKDLAAGMSVFSEELGVPLTKEAMEIIEPMRKEGPVQVEKGLIPGANSRLRDAYLVIEACLSIFAEMKRQLIEPTKKTKD